MKATEAQMKFKCDTGINPTIEIDSTSMTDEVDTYPMEGEDSETIIRMIDNLDYDWAIPVSLLPNNCQTNAFGLKIYSPEYVEWLEENLK